MMISHRLIHRRAHRSHWHAIGVLVTLTLLGALCGAAVNHYTTPAYEACRTGYYPLVCEQPSLTATVAAGAAVGALVGGLALGVRALPSWPGWWLASFLVAGLAIGLAGYCLLRRDYNSCVVRGAGEGCSFEPLGWFVVAVSMTIAAVVGWGATLSRMRHVSAASRWAAFSGPLALVCSPIPILDIVVSIIVLPVTLTTTVVGYRESREQHSQTGVMLAALGALAGTLALVLTVATMGYLWGL